MCNFRFNFVLAQHDTAFGWCDYQKKNTQKKPKIYMQGNTCNSQSSSIIQVVWTLYSDFIVPIGIDLYLKP